MTRLDCDPKLAIEAGSQEVVGEKVRFPYAFPGCVKAGQFMLWCKLLEPTAGKLCISDVDWLSL